jgi:rhodanese-related sulfurtransferase
MAIPDYIDTVVRVSISPVEVWGLMEQKPDRLVVVDVRDGPVSFVIPDAIRIPLHMIASREGELPHDKLVVLYSSDSNCTLATRATVTLLKAGVDARQMTGGISGWSLLKLPLDG